MCVMSRFERSVGHIFSFFFPWNRKLSYGNRKNNYLYDIKKVYRVIIIKIFRHYFFVRNKNMVYN